jgi:hypothetical protein
MANQWRFSPALALLTSCSLLASGLAAADRDLAAGAASGRRMCYGVGG